MNMFLLFLIGLASARLTRLVVKDVVFQPIRVWLDRHASERTVYMTNCPHCASFWITLLVFSAVWAFHPMPAPGALCMASWWLAGLAYFFYEMIAVAGEALDEVSGD